MKDRSQIVVGDALSVLRRISDNYIDCCVTSPPYFGLRDYGVDGQLGLEESPEEYISKMVKIFREVRRTLRPDGTLWLNLGDSYAGSGKGRMGDGSHSKDRSKSSDYFNIVGGKLKGTKAVDCKRKELIGIPWRLALALREDGWYLRQDIVWYKPNAMPESVKDRCTKSHEYIFLLTKSDKYYFDGEAIKEPAIGFGNAENMTGLRNRRDVWSVETQGYSKAHFATFPEKLIEPCILAGSRKGGVILDPFLGSGTAGTISELNSTPNTQSWQKNG